MPTQGLAAHVIGDFLPADVHVDVMVREVLWWHRPQKQVSPRSGLCHPLPTPHPVTCAAGTVDTALATKVQDEGGTTEAMEGAFCVHALPALTDHVLAFVVICGVREWCSGSVTFDSNAQERICLGRPTKMPILEGLSLETISESIELPSPQTRLLQWASFPGGTPSKSGTGVSRPL